ncbi:AAA family ATPase [Aliiroseovarius sp. PTFE2010]|uniref:AAA family ATPase n=1 Tax=Aliiroseovarius sp. PTFE2010 TaxID=3417190 RepID=UPI003CF09BF2
MTRVPILPIPKNYKTQDELVDHFVGHILTLRADRRAAFEQGQGDIAKPEKAMSDDEKIARGLICDRDIHRAKRRAQRMSRHFDEALGMRHLHATERARLVALGPSVAAVTIESEHRADEMAAQLEAEMPWMRAANEKVWQDMRLAARRDGVFTVAPLLVDGPPGVGKSTWARRVAQLVGAPSVLLDATKGGAGMELAGLERGYSSSQPGRPVEAILTHKVANPVVVVDEICKASTRFRSKSETPFADTLLSMIEPATSRKWDCVYFRVPFDMSHVSWIMTSNNRLGIPAVLRSRLTIVEVASPGLAHLAEFVTLEGRKRDLSQPAIDAVIDALQRVDISGLSLRSVSRMLRLAEVIETRPMVH